MKFNELGLSEKLLNAITDLGYEDPTEVQEKVIPELLEKKDLIVKSKTGTGKTAAYGLPVIQNLDFTKKGVQAIVICPTRELAMQVEKEFKKYIKYMDNVKMACVYGGQNIEKQTNAIRGNTKIVIGTPGRMLDHIKRRTLWLNSVSQVILDEADEMLDMGFKEDIQKILRFTSNEKYVALFSATIDEKIAKIAAEYQKEENIIDINKDDTLAVESIKQLAIDLKLKMKAEATFRILKTYNAKKSIVFCVTKKNVDIASEYLLSKNCKIESLHSDINQYRRNEIMQDFKSGKIDVLVATDVAARGLDVDNLDLVINYDLPYEMNQYVHRIGRTGRNGKVGIAITFTVGKERERLEKIMEYINSKVEYINIPRLDDLKLEDNKNDVETLTSVTKVLQKKTTDEKIKVKFNIGKLKNIKSKDILGSIGANTAVPKSEVGHIQVENDYSTIVIPAEYESEIIKSMTNKEVKGVKVTNIQKI